jgi:hypothetical protein
MGALGIGCGTSVSTVAGTGAVGRSEPGVVARGAMWDALIVIPEWALAGTLLGATELADSSARRRASIGTPGWGMAGTLLGALIGTWRGGGLGRHAGHAKMGTIQVYTHLKLYC